MMFSKFHLKSHRITWLHFEIVIVKGHEKCVCYAYKYCILCDITATDSQQWYKEAGLCSAMGLGIVHQGPEALRSL